MRKIVLLFILISSYAFSQSVNDYQYVIVPVKFDIFKKDDQYGLNTLTKLLLQKYGFKAYLSNEEIPLNVERCNFLYANVLEKNGVFSTKVKVVLKDCQEKVIFETQFGESREKEFAKAYNLALRDTGKSFDKLDYKYNGGNRNVAQAAPVINQVEAETPVNSDSIASTDVFYFAQPTANGFQVVNNEPKVILRLFNTSQKSVFIAEKETIKGVVIFKNGQWFFEYYENGKLISESWNLKF
ncbi:hypothetical protein [Flavobacterium sangjuense]|uniref:Uncharacterized protein n=1 Tax=Flavobacterium sangjuense TaxID=2518177 RepID=A0A4P7PSQ4_9FLAO|nr:hypothetical protein [Flavobacterium sangjuense]QBZ97676.1 hypothetical protein GS03_01174 [Flavobacterium sangjuense]